ncbi:MAG: hypothetical protein WCZ28_06105 [Burkholderiaceae bacterium]
MTPVADPKALPATEIPIEEEDAFRLLAELQVDGGRKPLDPERWIALAPDGTYALLEFIGSVVRQIGPRVGFDDAVDRAAAICAGNDHARTDPLALQALALALAGGVARKRQDEAARRRRHDAAKTEMTGGGSVSPRGAAGDVPTPAAPPHANVSAQTEQAA